MTAVTTATPPTRRRRVGIWVSIGVVVVVVGVIATILSGLGQWNRRDVLDPESTGADGARALARVLDQHGVAVHVVRDRHALDEALDAAGRTDRLPAMATLVLPDSPLLSDATFQKMADGADDVVIAQPQARAARVLFDAELSGYGTDQPIGPGCALPAAQRSGSISPGTLFAPPNDPDITACYTVDGDAALLQRTLGGRTVTLLDAAELFTNATLADDGNAALGVNLLGVHSDLIWYVPSAGDADAGEVAADLGSLTPGWVSPVIVLLLLVGVAAAVWRGRRFGPLVAENLPVTVRAAETTDGRARLYARSGDRVHVADRLRIGTLTRLARVLGLGRATPANEISDAVADRLGMPRAQVRGILIDDQPATDRELLTISDRLRDLERRVHQAVRPDTNPPTDTGRTP
ncbi:DUF4350 domain-containing protein [Microbacterium horticulturae]|uniref:DUF4350 domain-containing protein n=1 Tax=Microbacterium horticulturae TaxID=3028316 RepID=A0ABY8BUK9_9MICO|nr:DUF4350 domain-containing protein [Microbacterium sp. KACC 23027]WEG07871.1 DUF4350 domain-containing protein [Microbacterium sp. KACC 23027]